MLHQMMQIRRGDWSQKEKKGKLAHESVINSLFVRKKDAWKATKNQVRQGGTPGRNVKIQNSQDESPFFDELEEGKR